MSNLDPAQIAIYQLNASKTILLSVLKCKESDPQILEINQTIENLKIESLSTKTKNKYE